MSSVENGCQVSETTATRSSEPQQRGVGFEEVLAEVELFLDAGAEGNMYLPLHCHRRKDSAFRWAAMSPLFAVLPIVKSRDALT